MSSTITHLTYADLERVLMGIGFVVERPNHTYQVFHYASPDILIVLPSRPGDDAVDATHLLAVRTHVLENGVLDAATFDALVRGAQSVLCRPQQVRAAMTGDRANPTGDTPLVRVHEHGAATGRRLEVLRRAVVHPGLAVLNAGLALGHSIYTRGLRRSLLLASLGLGLPALAEGYAVGVQHEVHHHMQPQRLGVPLAAVLSWYSIISNVFSLLESAAARRGVPRPAQRLLLPAGTAVVATSLDLVLDCMGLDLGLWEWRTGGPYAPEIVGTNGQRGIPLVNFVGWLGLSGGVVACYLLLESVGGAGRSAHEADPASAAWMGRAAALILMPYYLSSAVWALERRRGRYLVYSALCPLVMIDALRG